MAVTFTTGDIFATRAQALAVGLNSVGRIEVAPFFTALHDRYPAFMADYQKRGHAGKLVPGDIWIWRESQPWLAGLIVRETPQGATRLRYVEAALLNLSKNWEREGIVSLAVMQFISAPDWTPIRALFDEYFGRSALQLMVYEFE
jgi:hypothetical protein